MKRIYEYLRIRVVTLPSLGGKIGWGVVSSLPFLALSILFAFPLGVSAQSSVAKQYCPDKSKDFFKGSIYHEGGQPWIETIVDPKFEKDIMKPRQVSLPLSPTPIYDLVVRIKPEFNYYCIPGWVGADGKPGREVTAEDLKEKRLPIEGFITIGEGAAIEKLVGPGTFSLNGEQDEQKRFIYEWKIKGMPDGIASGEKLEKLIAFIAQGKSPGVLLEILQKDGGIEKEQGGAAMGLCAPMWGSGKHSLAYMRAALPWGSSFDIPTFITAVESVRTQGFEKIDPFKKYRASFSHTADLTKHDKNSVFAEFDTLTDGKGLRYTLPRHNKVFANIAGKSGCSGTMSIVLAEHAPAEGVSSLKGRALFVDINVAEMLKDASKRQPDEIKPTSLPVVVMHEFGHGFAGLNDEYEYGGPSEEIQMPYRNCSTVPTSAFRYKGKLYGDTTHSGCSYSKVFRGGRVGDRTEVPIYRPSFKSMMKAAQSGETRFNVISCGYIIAAIKGGTGPEHWAECMGLDTVKPSGTAYVPGSGPLASFFNAMLTAQVGAALADDDETIPDEDLVIVENFASDGTITGNLFDIPKGEETMVSGTDGLNWVEENGIWVMQLIGTDGEVYHEIPLPPLEELPTDGSLAPGSEDGSSVTCHPFTHFLAFGSASNDAEDVTALHSLLHTEGFLAELPADTSLFTEDTADALKAFQKKYELSADGFAGAQTRSLLEERSGCSLEELPTDGPLVGGLNLTATTPTVTGSSAGEGKLYAGTMTFRAVVESSGGETPETFKNILQYRAATEGGPWIDWVKLDVPPLSFGQYAILTNTWDGGVGEWEFRLVADSDKVIAESDEEDNFGESVRVSIVPRPGAAILPPPPASGTSALRFSTPIVSGRQAGLGKLVAGTMSIQAKVTNIGDGTAPPFQLLFLYSQDGSNWHDWVRVGSPRLAPEAERTARYSWEGGVGGWYAKICEDIKDTCSPPVFFEVVSG